MSECPGTSAASSVSYPGETFWSLVERRIALTPDAPMICDEHRRRVTFAEFGRAALARAAALRELGIGAGDLIAWQLPTRLETAVFMAALGRLGAVQVPIVPLFRARELGFIFAELRPAFAFTPGVLGRLDYTEMTRNVAAELGLPTRVLALPHVAADGDTTAMPPQPVSGSEMRWIFSTSGTTGRPKGVLHTDHSLLAAARVLSVGLQLTPHDVITMNYPIAHCGGPVSVLMQLLIGHRSVYTEQFQPEAAVALYREEGVTVAGTGLPFYQAYLAEQRKSRGKPIMPALRALHGGGGPASPQVHRDVDRELGVPLLHVWGMTEALTLTRQPDGDVEARAHSAGVPGDGVEVVVVGADGTRLPDGESGELLIRGSVLCCGYTDPEIAALAFTEDGFLRSGDVGYRRADGRIVLTGRKKELIIRKGENISPTEVEQVLVELPTIAEVAVIGLPDDERGELACAVVVPSPGERIELFDLAVACRSAGLATYKIPERLELVDSLPRNAMMKVQKELLRAQILGRDTAGG